MFFLAGLVSDHIMELVPLMRAEMCTTKLKEVQLSYLFYHSHAESCKMYWLISCILPLLFQF